MNTNDIIGTKVKIDKLEIAQNDFPEEMDWDTAIQACLDLGDGWKLPTDKELDFRDLWERTRMLILNNGNHQMRSAISEVTRFIRAKYRYNYKFYVKPEYPPQTGDDK